MSGLHDPNRLVDPQFLGIPYVPRGRGFEGCDCIGLVLLWFREHGYDLGPAGSEPYTEAWSDEDPQRYLKALLEYGEFVDFRQVQPRDVVMILNHSDDLDQDARRVDSIGVVIDPGHFLVSTREFGSRVGMFTVQNLRYFVGAIRPAFDAQKQLVKPHAA
ncbi:MAG: hypothetical protein HY600_05325 [Candidatus Omnitrophica bacterium]|nr:hypothetical protein [Candidatus Omnitrophota bacterium]